jgi:hypothetical protein
MSYKIRIERLETEARLERQQWQRLSTDGVGNSQYGYVESPNMLRDEVETLIYEQTVDELDLVAVINAINSPNSP